MEFTRGANMLKKFVFLSFLLSFFLFTGCSSENKVIANDTNSSEDADIVTFDEDISNEVQDEDTCTLQIYYEDKDKDGFGNNEAFIETCEKPEGYVKDNTDCNDNESTVYPEAKEIPYDNIDQDCNGSDWLGCTDIGCDGYPDIVFANTDDENSTNINSYVYLGSSEGFSAERKIEIPTIGAMGVDVADVNRDGYLDIAFAAVKEKTENDSSENRNTTSLLYYGTADGFDLTTRVEFPTVGCSDITLADLNKDGWIDVITPNRYNGEGMTGSGYKINSYVYWGSENGFDIENRLELPTVGAAKARVADLNKDGYNDIVFPNGVQEYVGVFESYIYWGSESGWSSENRTSLESVSPETATVTDINDDGFADIFISGWLCLTKCKLKNRIYWGSESGFSNDNYTKLDDLDGGTDAIFIDINNDGKKDLVFASGAVELTSQEFSKESYVLWGTDSETSDKYSWNTNNMITLPATASSEAGVRDLNGDGYLDIVFASHYPPKDDAPQVSQIYWGSENGFDSLNITELPTQHAAGMKIVGEYLR